MERTHSFGYWLRRRRKALDLTQSELAQQASCSLDLIQKVETDARRPSRQLAEKLADCLGVEASERWLCHALMVSRVLNDQASIAWCLAGLGTAAALDEELERAARLWGAAERLRQAIGCRPAPAARATFERAIAGLRGQIGAEAFASAWAGGRTLSVEQALAEVLEEAATPARS